MEKLIGWLEKMIEGCDDLGGMEKEKWAFIQTLKKVRDEQCAINGVVFNEADKGFKPCGEVDSICNCKPASECGYTCEVELCINCKKAPANRGLGGHTLICSDCWNSMCD